MTKIPTTPTIEETRQLIAERKARLADHNLAAAADIVERRRLNREATAAVNRKFAPIIAAIFGPHPDREMRGVIDRDEAFWAAKRAARRS